MLDSIEFARGDYSSTWGSKRAAMGHPEPFDLKYIAIGNEDCWKPYYRGMSLCIYLVFGNGFMPSVIFAIWNQSITIFHNLPCSYLLLRKL